VTSSFFVCNFPEEVVYEDLWKLFLPFGRVGEVFLSRRLDKWNRRFNFIKFIEVGNVEALEAEMHDVW
jgi:hypothetical protein